MGDLVGSCFPVSPLTKDTIQGVGITRSLFYQKGRAAGQCSIQAPDHTCSIHMQERLHRLGQGKRWGTGTTGCLGPGLFCLHWSKDTEDWAASPWLEPNHSGQEESWHKGCGVWPAYSTGFCIGCHSFAHWKGPARHPGQYSPSRKRVSTLSSLQKG